MEIIKMKNTLLAAAMLLSATFAASAQTLPSSMKAIMTEKLARDVKSLDEFGARFNGKESHPDIPADSADSRLANICALFDVTADTPEPIKLQVLEFCDSVLSNDVKFSLMSPQTFGVSRAKVSAPGKNGGKKDATLSIVLQQERPEGRYARWGIAGLTGLAGSGLIGLTDLVDISPVDHELRFMSLSDVVNQNRKLALGFRTSQSQLDELSVFLTMIHDGCLTIEEVEDVTFYNADVPGFIFAIRELGEKSGKTGWVITELMAASDDEKTAFIDNLFHNSDE